MCIRGPLQWVPLKTSQCGIQASTLVSVISLFLLSFFSFCFSLLLFPHSLCVAPNSIPHLSCIGTVTESPPRPLVPSFSPSPEPPTCRPPLFAWLPVGRPCLFCCACCACRTFLVHLWPAWLVGSLVGCIQSPFIYSILRMPFPHSLQWPDGALPRAGVARSHTPLAVCGSDVIVSGAAPSAQSTPLSTSCTWVLAISSISVAC